MHAPQRTRVACVAYVNATPLIDGLDAEPGVDLSLRVPADLAAPLAAGEADVALLPVIDYARIPDLLLLPHAGGIGCDGPTLTVRLFSRSPLHRCTRLCCDPDSHTSVQLARIVLAETYGVTPELATLPDADGRDGEVLLLIGDKVVTREPPNYRHQLDLGGAWRDMTGLPFVFACWTARAGTPGLGRLVETLATCRRRGLSRVEHLIDQHAVPAGWPRDVARRYLTEYLHYEVGPRQLEAIALYHAKAAALGAIDAAPPLRTYPA